MPHRALITGASGQDGRLLLAALTERGWTTTGVVGPGRTRELDIAPHGDAECVAVDLGDVDACASVVEMVRPDVIFHLAAVSSVGQSWQDPVHTGQVNAQATAALLTAARDLVRDGHPVHVVNASSGEIFAGTHSAPQNESTPICPTSPYGVSKAYGHLLAAAFRAQGVGVSNAILYPHESPLRAPHFVTRKITRAVAEIAAGTRSELALGNLAARRDWGWAPDYVEAMISMATERADDDFVVATGVSHSVADFAGAAFAAAGIADWHRHVRTDKSLFRPADSIDLVGDSTRLRTTLGWRPTKTFSEVVAAMVEHDMTWVEHADAAAQPAGSGRTVA